MTHNWDNKRDVGRLTGRPWRRLRDAVLAREPLCRTCQAQGRIREATQVDHIIPLAQGGTNAVSNLAPICADCHKFKTANESAQAQGKRTKVAIGEGGWPVSARVAARNKPGSHWSR